MKVKNFIVKNKSFCFFAFLAFLIVLIAIFAPVITGGVSPSEAVLADALQPPSAEFSVRISWAGIFLSG